MIPITSAFIGGVMISILSLAGSQWHVWNDSALTATLQSVLVRWPTPVYTAKDDVISSALPLARAWLAGGDALDASGGDAKWAAVSAKAWNGVAACKVV